MIVEGYGCWSTLADDGMTMLFFGSWSVVLPLISVLFYCRESLRFIIYDPMLTSAAKTILVFYKHNRETNQFLQSNGSVTRRKYFRIVALACVDIILTFPLGVIIAASDLLAGIREPSNGRYRFYEGWSYVHSDWEPVGLSYSDMVDGPWDAFQLYASQWSSPILALAIFSFFGFTAEARAVYWRGFCVIARLFGWEPFLPKGGNIGEIKFNSRSQMSAAEV
jgi:hypothetical protein